MGRIVLLAVAAAYWLALLATVVAVSAVGEATHLRHPLYTLFVAAGIVLASAVLRWPPRRDQRPARRPSSIGQHWAPPPQPAPLPPRRRSVPYVESVDMTQRIPGVVKRAAWDAARAQAGVAGSPVTVAEPEEGATYVSGYVAGVTGDQTPPRDDDESRGYVAGAVDLERSRSDDEDGFPGVSRGQDP